MRLPPNYEPMPMRPLFFDLALNHVKVALNSVLGMEAKAQALQFPNIDDKIEQVKDKPKSKGAEQSMEVDQQEGIGGMLKGWFWGSGGK